MKKEKNEQTKLFDMISNRIFTHRFISGIAGDRLQSTEEKELYETLLEESEGDLYVKVLFHLTNEVFNKEKAITIWKAIIDHKSYLSRQLNRNVEITVATLDYLTNIKDEITEPKIIGSAFLGKIVELSSVDTLTKLYNRQHLMQVLSKETSRFKRYKIPFSLLMIDIDHFKSINDKYGHQTGDDVLVEISKLLILDLRELDICTRFGGEEFMIVLPHTTEPESYELAERIRERVEEKYRDEMKITISIGISIITEQNNEISEIIKRADNALYQSKKNGRNKTTLSDI